MTLACVRNTYRVPARRGQRITYSPNGIPIQGEIRAAAGQYIRVRFDGDGQRLRTLHPTWRVGYHEGASK